MLISTLLRKRNYFVISVISQWTLVCHGIYFLCNKEGQFSAGLEDMVISREAKLRWWQHFYTLSCVESQIPFNAKILHKVQKDGSFQMPIFTIHVLVNLPFSISLWRFPPLLHSSHKLQGKVSGCLLLILLFPPFEPLSYFYISLENPSLSYLILLHPTFLTLKGILHNLKCSQEYPLYLSKGLVGYTFI